MKQIFGKIYVEKTDRLLKLNLFVDGFTFTGSPSQFNTHSYIVINERGEYYILKRCAANDGPLEYNNFASPVIETSVIKAVMRGAFYNDPAIHSDNFSSLNGKEEKYVHVGGYYNNNNDGQYFITQGQAMLLGLKEKMGAEKYLISPSTSLRVCRKCYSTKEVEPQDDWIKYVDSCDSIECRYNYEMPAYRPFLTKDVLKTISKHL